jgi:CheY-like chemotaxis protein
MATTQSDPKCRVLIVDDDANTVQSMASLFEMEGHVTRTALDGIEAVAEGPQFGPHLILLDIVMPEMDGFALATAARGTDWGQHAVLVAVTGFHTPAIEERCAEVGFDHYLLKPVNYGDFADALSKATARFFNVVHDFAMLKQRQVVAITTFVRLRVELIQTYLHTSAISTDPVRKERNRAKARKAYDEADKWVNRETGMTPEDQRDIAAQLAQLKPKLYIQ